MVLKCVSGVILGIEYWEKIPHALPLGFRGISPTKFSRESKFVMWPIGIQHVSTSLCFKISVIIKLFKKKIDINLFNIIYNDILYFCGFIGLFKFCI